MKEIRSIISATFIILVLFSSSSFMVGMHFCAGQIQNIALFTKADGCEMEQQIPPCHKHESKPCCEDETVVHTGEDFHASLTDITILAAPALDVALPHVLISEVIPSAPVSRTHFYYYDQPLPPGDLTIRYRILLI